MNNKKEKINKNFPQQKEKKHAIKNKNESFKASFYYI